MLFLLLTFSLLSFAENKSAYGDIIKNTPEYEKITKEKDDDRDDNDRHYHYYHDPFYRSVYPHYTAHYSGSTHSGRSSLSGHFYLGVTIGDSAFDYDDIDDGDASIFYFGYRPDDSHLGYELSFFDSGDSEVSSLTDVTVKVDTFNLALTVNSSRNNKSRLNLFGQSGIYFADTALTGPFDSANENSNGLLLAAGIEIMLNRHFSLRAVAQNFFDVEDFADDKSILIFNFGGQLVF